MKGPLLDKPVILKLNKLWMPIRISTPREIIGAFSAPDKDGEGRIVALDITYAIGENGEYDWEAQPDGIRLVHSWDEWITLPVRDCDMGIVAARSTIRVPLVVITAKYLEMPEKRLGTDLSTIYEIYNGECQISKKKIPKSRATRDHKIPKSRGGKTEHSNLLLVDIEFNQKKGNKLLSEMGMRDIPCKVPRPKKMYELIKPRTDIPQWNYFLINKGK